jgi:hypothetical protein
VRANWPAVPGVPPAITFTTVPARRYRVECSPTLSNWAVLYDEIQGTGREITVRDVRNLAGVQGMYYRVLVF